MNMKKILGMFLLLAVLFTGSSVFADTHLPPGGGGVPAAAPTLQFSTQLNNPINVDTFDQLVSAVIKAAVQVLSPFVVLAFIYAGFLFVKAQGKAEELETAKKAILWSVVGAFILMGAWGFAQIIGETVMTITG